MNFRQRKQDEPEINLIPFIDVLLVVLIFLMLSTTYSKFTEIQLKLPTANTEAQKDYPKEMVITVGADGSYGIDRVPVAGRDVAALVAALSAIGMSYTSASRIRALTSTSCGIGVSGSTK